MLRHGASLAEIGEVLRHRSIETTKIYTKVDLDSLRALRCRGGRCVMNTLCQAVQEYLSMRRSLDSSSVMPAGCCSDSLSLWRSAAHPISQPSWRSPGHNNRRLCNRRVGAPPECRAHLRAPSLVRLIHALRFHRKAYCHIAQESSTVPLHGQGHPELIACGAFATRSRWATTMDLPLLVRIIERDWLATRRSMQSRASGCGSQAGVLTIEVASSANLA